MFQEALLKVVSAFEKHREKFSKECEPKINKKFETKFFKKYKKLRQKKSN